ncbi:hypothetical protein ACI78R_16215 [Geodermatophilus sp. SYSU D01106]
MAGHLYEADTIDTLEEPEDDREQPAETGEAGLGPGPRRLLAAFALFTALAAHQLLRLGGHTEHAWAWTIQARPTVAFLGAAYAAGFVLSVAALRQRSWAHVRVAVVTVTVFTVLTLAATYWHAHKLHLTAADPLARSAAWVWTAVYLAVPVAGLVVLLRQPAHRHGARRALPRWVRAVLAAQGLVLGAVGAVLFASGLSAHHGTHVTGSAWPWALTPLSAQVVGAWLVALGVGAALVVRETDVCRLHVPAVTYTAFGVFQWAVLLRFRDELVAGPALWAYAAVLTAVVATGGYGWWLVRRQGTSSPAGGRGVR